MYERGAVWLLITMAGFQIEPCLYLTESFGFNGSKTLELLS